MNNYLAIDMGASSGRHILGHLDQGRLVLEEIYRFDNTQIRQNGHDCWDIQSLAHHVIAGLAACKKAGRIPTTIGIDTWGVDFILLDENLEPCSDLVAYRDARTEGMDEVVKASVPLDELYRRTGIQQQPFNTIYQLVALQKEHPEQLARARHLLMVPEYLNFILTGVLKNEWTNATTTNLVNVETKTWDWDVIDRLHLPRMIFGPLHQPGEEVGPLTFSVAQQVGFQSRVMLPATHDTGSAFLSVPARDEKAVFISSGTWSLLGVENAHAITTKESQEANFTNEGGAWARTRYLKNIMGLWMIQSIRRELNGVDYVHGQERNTAWSLTDYEKGHTYSFNDLEKAARAHASFAGVVDANDTCFLSPASMIAQVIEKATVKPTTVGELMQCVYHSLAQCYARAIEKLSSLTNQTYTSINIVGGGSKDGYLNELTARATHLDVFAGPTEGTAIGNLIVQMIALNEWPDLASARACVRTSFDVHAVTV